MAGSFDIFRKYQRALLAGVAILAMLAFFVLPPFLQMAPETGAVDPLVATWNGGGIRESELEWAVAMRRVINDFLRESVAASGRDPESVQSLGESEADVVRTLLLAREAEANGIVIGNAAVNQFLGQLTQNMVRPEQFEAIIARRRLGQAPVAVADVFETLRTELAAARMMQLSSAGFAGDPPGARWDIFRRLELEATVEVVPVVVESFAADVPPPSEADLRALFDRHKDALPVDRSPEPGFKEPHRISYDWVGSDREALEAAAEKDVKDEEIEKFYEDNKVRLYRAKPKPADAPPAAEAPTASKAGEPAAEAKPSDSSPAVDEKADEKPADAKADEKSSKPADEPPAPDADGKEPAAPAAETPSAEGATDAKAPQSATPARGPFRAVKFRQPAAADADAVKADAPAPAPADAPEAATDSKGPAEVPAQAAPAAGASGSPGESPKPEAAATPPLDVEPLEQVRDDVRKRLAAEAVGRRLDELFRAIAADVAGFSRDLSRWKAESGDAENKPVPPDVEAIARKQGLKAGRAEKRTAGEALRDGGVGTSFQLSLDPRSPMGFRQAQWADLFFGMERPLWRTVETRDVPGNRYLSWKTDDVPSFVPEFAAVRADVERAWRIIEARPLARKVAEEVAGGATGGRSLAEAVAGRTGPKLEAASVGPFTWLPRDPGPAGSAAGVSQPEGLEMPGEDFMQAVFALEPGGTGVAFNEPRTVCYAIRLVSFSPSEDDLRTKFISSTSDQRRLGMVAERERMRAFQDWLADVQKRAGLEWKRPPE